jgi:Ni,Fe-hydrogenase III small subunit
MLLVTGPVAANMKIAVQRAYEATPEPKLVVAVGDCGCTGGIFGESYASCGRVSNVIPVDVILAAISSSPAQRGSRTNPARHPAGDRHGMRVKALEP